MKSTLITICILLLLTETNSIFWKRRRRRHSPPPCRPVRNCRVGSWTRWSSCSHLCGTSGTQQRTRGVIQGASCGGSCNYHLRETQACNRGNCRNGGTPHSSGCRCRAGYRGTCCEGGEFTAANLNFRPRSVSLLFLLSVKYKSGAADHEQWPMNSCSKLKDSFVFKSNFTAYNFSIQEFEIIQYKARVLNKKVWDFTGRVFIEKFIPE